MIKFVLSPNGPTLAMCWSKPSQASWFDGKTKDEEHPKTVLCKVLFQRVFLQFKKCHFWWESQKGWFKISYRIPLLHHHVPILQFPLMVGKNRCNFQTSHGFPCPLNAARCGLDGSEALHTGSAGIRQRVSEEAQRLPVPVDGSHTAQGM